MMISVLNMTMLSTLESKSSDAWFKNWMNWQGEARNIHIEIDEKDEKEDKDDTIHACVPYRLKK